MFNKLLGKLSDLWTIPLALFIAVFYNWISELLGLFSMTPEKIGKIVPTFVLLLLVLGLSRIIHWAQYPDTYHFGLMKNSNKAWNDLDSKEKFKYSWQQRLFIALLLVGILWAM